MKKDQTFWLTGLNAGTTYTVEEISNNDDYKIKSVHVNYIDTGKLATGTVTQYLIDDVDFVNTAVGEGNLVITKQVVDERGNTVDVNDNIEFTINVALTNAAGAPVSGNFEATGGRLTVPANGKFTVNLSDGESFVVRGIPEKTKYTVTESETAGFKLNEAASSLTGTVDATANDQAIVVNTYTPSGTDGENISVEVTKTISGNRTTWQNGESYSFTLERMDAARAAGKVIATDTISYSDNAKKISFSLEDEDYTTAGTYYYRITEEVGNQGGITYDTATRSFAVVVADSDMDGDLEITAVNNELNTTVSKNGNAYTVSANFNNVYAPTGSAIVNINVKKEMEGDYRLNGFQFALYSSEDIENADEVLRSTVTDAEGKASFSLSYAANRATAEGDVHTYWMAEIDTGNPNITYDDTVYKVEITVKDNGDGTISATATVYDLDSNNPVVVPTFTNTFIPSTSDYISFYGEKTISVGNRIINKGEFAFKLEPHSETPNAPMPSNDVVRNEADGSFAFPAIEFNNAGIYKYVISEIHTGIGGFKYDTSKYHITVTVTDSNAVLTASVTSLQRVSGTSTTNADKILFENEYYTIAATLKFSGTKHLTGKTMQDGEFEFEIKALTDGAPMPPGDTVVINYKNGTFSFATITFENAGTFVYTITEVDGGDNHYTYDKSVYTITVTVTDNSEGRLSASYTITKNNMSSNEIVFSNGFVSTPYSYDIDTEFAISKQLNGRPIADGEFEFILMNATSGEQIGEAVTNDATGNIDFPALSLPYAGTYRYKIMEKVGGEKGVTYDTTVYHVVVDVKQYDNGYLYIDSSTLYKAYLVVDDSTGTPTETTVYEEVTSEGKIDFINYYSPDPADIGLGGMKYLAGRDLKDGEFTFNLYFAKYDNGKWVRDQLVEQVTNDADGKFSFETRTAELGATYIYFITEDATNPDETITYDDTEYMVVVTATDNLDGTMTVNYDYTVNGENAEGVSFSNIYTAPTPDPEGPNIPKTGVENTHMILWLAVLFISGGAFTGLTIYNAKRAKKD